MYLARTRIVTVPADPLACPAAGIVRKIIRQSCADSRIVLEHVHVAAEADRIDITLFVQAGSQTDADAMARLIGARVCLLIGGRTGA